jgi:hypothetical protein
MPDFIVSDKTLDKMADLHYYQDRCEIVKIVKKNSQFCPAMQCGTCIHAEKRTCMYHGYPEDVIPPSCEYKIGISAQEAMKNLEGIWLLKEKLI